MLYPIRNNFRNFIDISGLWKFKADPMKVGEEEGWFNGFESETDIAVPGSWNEQLEEIGMMHYVGTAWYSKKVFIPSNLNDKKTWIRIGSADFNAKVWINGHYVGENNFGFLPFEFEISNLIIPGNTAEIIILVNNELNHESIPQGITSQQYIEENRSREETFPPARFDFSPYGGIHRPVLIVGTPLNHIQSIKIDTKIYNTTGHVRVLVNANALMNATVVIRTGGNNNFFQSEAVLKNGKVELNLNIEDCRFWSIEDPFLYTLNVKLLHDGEITDEYELPIGIREVKIEKNRLLLNGKEIYLKGFGKHEDFAIIGKGLFLPQIIKDFELMKWINSNSFRTSHYPYSEEMMFFADKKGFLVIDEIPAVSLDIRYANTKTLLNHKEYVKKLIERDYNHPSVIIWALGNEPNLVGYDGYNNGSGRNYWKKVFNYARTLDKDRPLTVPNCARAGTDDPVFEFCDIISLNRYYGWYDYPGRIEYGVEMLEKEMDLIYKKYSKPIMMTEFGADTLPGSHSISDQMFTEEYQEKLLVSYIKLLRSKEYIVGEHVWNFADFKTPQNMRRMVLNLKGILNRNRTPKSAAFKLKELWLIPQTHGEE